LALGAETAIGAKLRRRFCSFFSSYGTKIATLKKLGDKTAIKPKYYSVFPSAILPFYYFIPNLIVMDASLIFFFDDLAYPKSLTFYSSVLHAI